MGIPSHKFITPSQPPKGYAIKQHGTVTKTDLVWSSSEGAYLRVKEFPYTIGEDVDKFFGVATKA